MRHPVHKGSLTLPGCSQALLKVVERQCNGAEFLGLRGWIQQVLAKIVGLKLLQLLKQKEPLKK